MNWNRTGRRIKIAFQYVPFTLNSLLVVALGIGAWRLLYRKVPKEEEATAAFRPFVLLLGRFAFWCILALVLLSVLSTLAAWIHYRFYLRPKSKGLQLQFSTENRKGKGTRLFVEAILEKVRRPILGFVNGRLAYDDDQLTDKFGLLSNERQGQSFWRNAIRGRSRLLLPDIKEYQLRNGFVFFEDMLHIFSLAVREPVAGQFYQPPVLADEEDRDVFPKKTETMDVRIDQLRRVEGEYLNYKDFESGDDVRRIVWKIYAKNRELVVRVPELFEPYASHLYFYASFEAAVKARWLGEEYLKEMLNYYKNRVWTVYDTLSKKEWELRYIPDQPLTVPEHLGENERVSRIISNSNWHNDQALSDYFNPRRGAVLCISSLTSVEELAGILEQCDAGTVVYFVKISQVFRHFAAWGLLRRLIFLPPKDRLSRLRSRWLFSPMRVQVSRREKEIEALLAKSDVTVGIL